MAYETALAATKIISALFTAGLGILTVYLETREVNKKLTHKGRITAIGAIVMLLINIISTTIDSKNNNKRAEDTAREGIRRIEDQNIVISKLASIVTGIATQNEHIKESIHKQDVTIERQNQSLYQLRRTSLPLSDMSIRVDFQIPTNSILISRAVDKWGEEILEFLKTVPKEYEGTVKMKDEHTTAYFIKYQGKIFPSFNFNNKSFMYKDIDIINPITNPLSPTFNIAIIDDENLVKEIKSVHDLDPNKPMLKRSLLTLYCPTLDRGTYSYYPTNKNNQPKVTATVHFKHPTKSYETEKASSLLDLPGKYILITSSLYIGNGSFDSIAISFGDKESFSWGRFVNLKQYKQFYINNQLCALYRFKKEDFHVIE
jgi:hypothetical protein